MAATVTYCSTAVLATKTYCIYCTYCIEIFTSDFSVKFYE